MAELDDLLECTICSSQFTEPKLLPCLHSFCLRCLEQYVRRLHGKYRHTSRQKLRGLPCPVCRQDFKLPTDGCEDLPTNLFLARLNKENDSINSASRENCKSCGATAASSSVDQYCVECRQILCRSCAKLHKQFTVSKSHAVKTFSENDAEQLEDVFDARTSFCAKHDDQQVNMFCVTCNISVCVKCCSSRKHKTHFCKDIIQAAKAGDNNIDEALKLTSKKAVEVDGRKRDVQQQKVKFMKQLDEKEKEVCKATDDIKRAAEERQMFLIEQFRQMKQIVEKDVEIVEHDTELESSVSCNIHAFAQAVKQRGTYAEIAQHSTNIKERARRLKPVRKCNVCVPRIAFEAPETRRIQNSIKKLMPAGIDEKLSIKLRHMASQAATSNSKREATAVETVQRSLIAMSPANVEQVSGRSTTDYLKSPKLMATIKGKGGICGVTVLNDEIYVARPHTTDLDVYGGDKYSRRVVSVRGLSQPQDMVACQRNNRLYISDTGNMTIYVVSPTDGLVGKWSPSWAPHGLSVTSGGNVVVTLTNARKLQEFSSKGSLLRTVDLPSDVQSPWQAMRYTSQSYVVCFGQKPLPSGVAIVSADGSILHQTTVSQLEAPYCITVDKRGRVLVGDFNGGVYLLDSRLKPLRRLLKPEQGVSQATRLFLDENTGRLLVNSGCTDVLIFKVYRL